jgi:hypothetical protein
MPLKTRRKLRRKKPVTWPRQKDECLNQTNVQGDFSLIGSEFINFISTVATCRMIRKARTAGLLEKMSYGDMMDDLSSAWRRVDAPQKPASDDGYWIHTLNTVFDELEALGLSTPAPKPAPKKEAALAKVQKPASRSVREADPGRILCRTEGYSPANFVVYVDFQ